MSRRQPIRLFTEVAADSTALRTGLMYRKKLPWKSGMLFVFPSEGYHGFWMQNTYIPLDIAFITADFKIAEIHSMVPMSTKIVRPNIPCKYALEVNRGWFKKHSIESGAKIGGSLYHEAQTQNADMPEVAVVQSFKDAVNFANINGLEMRIKYMFADTGKVVDYVFVPLKQYLFYTSRDGEEFVVAPCKHASGDYRQFNVDNVIDFNLFIPPAEGQKKYFPAEDVGKEVVVPPAVPFNQEMEPNQVNVVEFPAGRAAARILKKVIKKAQEVAGGSDQAMMTDYWAEIKKKKERGLTEGEAILEFLKEKGGRGKKSKKKPRK